MSNDILSSHWVEAALARVTTSRRALSDAQDVIATTPPELLLTEMKDSRNRVREEHIKQLRAALLNQQIRKPEEKLAELEIEDTEVESFSNILMPVGKDLTRVFALEQTLAAKGALSLWCREVVRMTSELDELMHIGSSPPSLEALATARSDFSAARERYDAALLSSKQDGGSATGKEAPLVAAAKAELQRADEVLHKEKNRLEAIARAHWPELFHAEDGGAGGLGLGTEDEFRRADGLFLANRRLDFYSDVKPLSGKGGNHTVFKASFGGRPCCLKRFTFPADDSGKAKRHLVREARRLRVLGSHPFIASADAVFEEPPRHGLQDAYLQMPLYEGGDIVDYLRNNAPSTPRIKTILKTILYQAVSALDFVHSNGISHADVKLENIAIAVDANGVPSARLIDFELSRVDASAAGTSPTEQRVAMTTSQGLTMAYAAPEIQSGQPASFSSDMFSFGVCIFNSMKLLEQCVQNPSMVVTGSLNASNNLVDSSVADGRLGCTDEPHFGSLVESLLAFEPMNRPSAGDAMRHPFLDPLSAMVQAEEASAEVAEQRLRAEEEAAEARRRIQREAAIKQQQLEEQTAEAQRVLDGQKQELRKKEAVSARQERKIAEERARLKKEEENLTLEASKVGSEKAAVASRRKVRRTYPASSICFPLAAGVSILLK